MKDSLDAFLNEFIKYTLSNILKVIFKQKAESKDIIAFDSAFNYI